MSNPQQPAKMWSGRFREPADHMPTRWPWLLLCIALPFFPLARVVLLNTDILWISTLLVVAISVILLFIRTPAIAHTSLTRACLRLDLLCLTLSLLWFGLNEIRVATYDNAVEGQHGMAANLYWIVTERAQPVIQWCLAACAAFFLITGMIAVVQHLTNARRFKRSHV